MPSATTVIVGPGTIGGQTDGFLLTPALPGDANLDGKVDINDLTIVLANYGQTGMTWAQGEFTGDGTVDINDLTIVLAHYGNSSSRRPPQRPPSPSRPPSRWCLPLPPRCSHWLGGGVSSTGKRRGE